MYITFMFYYFLLCFSVIAYYADIIIFCFRLPFYKIIVPTVDTVRYQNLVGTLLSNNFPSLLIGPVGTGKLYRPARIYLF